jgi:hypothetical protein
MNIVAHGKSSISCFVRMPQYIENNKDDKKTLTEGIQIFVAARCTN